MNLNKFFSFYIVLFFSSIFASAQNINGAWISVNSEETSLILATENYIAANIYDRNCLIETKGGKYTMNKADDIFIEFDYFSNNPAIVGTSQSFVISQKKKNIEFEGKKFTKIEGNLAINGRWKLENDTTFLSQRGYKDYLIVAGNYFQIVRFNNLTYQLFDCFGGTFSWDKNIFSGQIVYALNDATLIGTKINYNTNLKAEKLILEEKTKTQVRSKLN